MVLAEDPLETTVIEYSVPRLSCHRPESLVSAFCVFTDTILMAMMFPSGER